MSITLALDTDLGSDVDDALALALLLGSPEIDLRLATTVYGDTMLRARLLSRLARLAGRDGLAIVPGRSTPLSGAEVWWGGHEGSTQSRLEDEPVADGDGVTALVEAVMAAPGTWDVAAIGPLTDIAAALDADPRVESAIRRLIVMGGDFSAEGRVAEHNLKSDIAAAQRVFQSGLEIVVGGLDLTRTVSLHRADVERIRAAGPLGSALGAELDTWRSFDPDDAGTDVGTTPHDPTVLLWLVEPELFTTEHCAVRIDADGRSWETADPQGRVTLLRSADTEGVRESLLRRIVSAGLSTG